MGHKFFFGFADADINVQESINAASDRLRLMSEVDGSTSWQDLQVDGDLIVNDVIEAIEDCSIGVFDITSMNENVLFELGYAIGCGKQIAVTREKSNTTTDRMFREFGLLTTTGYTSYSNSEDLYASLLSLALDEPKFILDSLLGENPTPVESGRLLYVPSMKGDEASRRLSRQLEAYASMHVVTLELDEYGSSPLAWLTQQIYASPFALFHLTPRNAYLADMYNRKVSLLAGISAGLGRHFRMVVSDEQVVALDYRDLRISYQTSRQLVTRVDSWLSSLDGDEAVSVPKMRKHLASEIDALHFGNHVAEADRRGLDEYFVETRDYQDVVDANATIFTGRKGTGKSANMLQAAEELRKDARNLVCVIKPASYELDALSSLLGKITRSHIGNYAIEGIWKYLLYTEVAATLVRTTSAMPAGIAANSAVDDLRAALEADHRGVDASFSVRLEALLDNLGTDLNRLQEDSIEAARAAIGKALYGEKIRGIRSALVKAMRDKDRIAVLIDNLDKAWEKGADLEVLSSLILGLLSTVGRVSDEFEREASAASHGTRFTLTVFLRSDIFSFVRDRAREPDKISTVEIEWRDLDLLARVLEDRFVASRGGKSGASDLWVQFFSPSIKGQPSKDYILSRVQPRPRDLVYFANAAVLAASNARHHIITDEDIEKAEIAYSQFAYDALLVEGIAAGVDLERVLLEFVGEPSEVSRNRLEALLSIGDGHDAKKLIGILRMHGFLGLETAPDRFDYGGTKGEMKRADVLSRKLTGGDSSRVRYQIHSAYRAHLVLSEE